MSFYEKCFLFNKYVYVKCIVPQSFFFSSCAEMQSSYADAIQSQSTLRLEEINCLSFVYKILVMAFRSSVNDVKYINVIVSNLGMKWFSGELTAKLVANHNVAQFK